MDKCKRTIIWILFVINITTTIGFILPNAESTTVKTQETTPLSELIKIQTDAIKKILSTNIQNNHDINLNKHSTSNCEDIETSIKQTLSRSQVTPNTQTHELQHPQIDTQTQKQVNIEIITTEINNEQIYITTETNKPEIAQTTITDLTGPTAQAGALPSGRTLFSIFNKKENEEATPHPTLNAVKLDNNQNYILIPCLKRVVHNGTRRNTEGIAQNAQTLELQEPQTEQAQPPSMVLEKVNAPNGDFLYYRYKNSGSTNNYEITQNVEQSETQKLETPQSLFLERVYSPKGDFLYYRYKNSNNETDITKNSEQLEPQTSPPSLNLEKVHAPNGEFLYYRYKTTGILNANEDIPQNSEQTETQTSETLPPSLIIEKVYSPSGEFMYYVYRYKSVVNSEIEPITSSTTTERTHEPVYTENMRFIVQMPYSEPEQIANHPWQFDQFAYYPKHIQPAYVNTPIEYKPTFHMIRTLALPGEYPASVLNDPQQNGANETKN